MKGQGSSARAVTDCAAGVEQDENACTMSAATDNLLDEEEMQMKMLLEYFLQKDEAELMKHKKCIHVAAEVPMKLVEEAFSNLEPVVMFEKNGSAIVAFKKAGDLNVAPKKLLPMPTDSAPPLSLKRSVFQR